MDIITLQSKTPEELRELLAEQREHLANLRFQMSTRELKNVHEIRNARRTIARILTIISRQQSVVGSQSSAVGGRRLAAADPQSSTVSTFV